MLTAIPDRCFEQHQAILGKTGSGKTYTAKGMVERLLAKKQRVCVLDPTSAWWGLRSAADGEQPGFPIVVFGGEHGDVAIDRQHGQSIAEIVATTDTSTIIDVRMMTVGERTQFATDFAETLLRKNVGVIHLIIDEAHVFAPQGKIPDPQSGRMLHAFNNLVSLGRGRGLRITLISQRPAKLHKDSLTQVETMVAMRLIAPQDRNAVKDWMLEWADPKAGADMIASLPSLKTGEGWVWAPELNIFDRAKFPQITTYDNSRAPDGTAAKIVLAQIDLPSIEQRLQAVAIDIAANDPKRLKARIAELESRTTVGVDPAEVEAARSAGYADALERARFHYLAAVRNWQQRMAAETERLVNEFATSPDETNAANSEAKTRIPETTPSLAKTVEKTAMPNEHDSHRIAPSDSSVGTGGLHRILIALAQRPNGLTNRQIGVRAGLSSKSGTFSTYLSTARTNGWIEGSGILRLTGPGKKALGSYQPLPSGRKLLEHWLSQLGRTGESRMLEALYRSHPKGLSNEDLGRLAGISHASGTFSTYLSKLRTLELITGERGQIRISEELI